MKKVLFTTVILILVLAFGSVSAEGNKPEPGMSATLERGGYYGIGADIPEGSYILTCPNKEETEWVDTCDVLVSTYDMLQYSEDTGLSLDFPEDDDGYRPLRVFLRDGMVMRIRYSDVIITAAEPVQDGVLETRGYYGIGYDIPEGNYYLSCIQNDDEEWYSSCQISILTNNSLLDGDFSLDIYADSYEEDDTVHPTHLFLKAGTILQVLGLPMKITEADPVIFK